MSIFALNAISPLQYESEELLAHDLLSYNNLQAEIQNEILDRARKLIQVIRSTNSFCMEAFMQQFRLSRDEGIAIMCLAEGLLRIPDKIVAFELAIDKLADKDWSDYVIKSKSIKAYLTSFGLYTAGKFADATNINTTLAKLITNMGKSPFLIVLKSAIAMLSNEFIFSKDILSAVVRTAKYSNYKFSFDLLGESARTMHHAQIYYDRYLDAIENITQHSMNEDQRYNTNLSVKFTSIYPRFELAKKSDIIQYLVPKLVTLIKKIQGNNLTITFDAEESYRLDIYLHIFTQLILHPQLENFDGIGLVIQAYMTNSIKTIDYVVKLSKQIGHRIPVRLVKGAYWDSEIKYAQEMGLQNYPVFTKKDYTDASYIACAKAMLDNHQYIFPQFATHNALTVSTIISLAKGKEFELQKLYGMGDALYHELVKDYNVRIYAPVGGINDLLAYLMRRILENGANSCFMTKVKDTKRSIDTIAYNLHDRLQASINAENSITLPRNLYPNRDNAMGYDISYLTNYDDINKKVIEFYHTVYHVGPIINGKQLTSKRFVEHFCPAKFAEKFAEVSYAIEGDIKSAIESSVQSFTKWSNTDVSVRADVLNKIADLYEQNRYELYAILIKEAGKTINDAIGEVVEAIDFCRYYANQAIMHMSPKVLPGPTGESNVLSMHPRGVFLCISPWNFPLAIFTGQIVAALVCGNAVIAKPADQTPVIAHYAVQLMYKAGIPKDVLQLIVATGNNIGKYAVPDERITGVAFTGSTKTAQLINLSLAQRSCAIVPFIAETGGQNAMIVDSSALLEQVTDDVINSAFGSVGQRCSALRILYVQEEIYDALLDMIKGAMALLKVSDNSVFSTDIGPVIDKNAMDNLSNHIQSMQDKAFKVITHPQNGLLNDGYFFYPHIIEVNSINDIPDEKFGPILHITKYKLKQIDDVINQINNYGFGLTFGVHSRVEKTINYITSKVKAGNIYVNRSIIAAKVESQPFGGENKSGTGFKAGGPHYLLRFMTERTKTVNLTAVGGNVELLTSDND